MSRSEMQITQEKTWEVPRYLKLQRSADVQLIPIPNTFKKLAPQPLPACSTQTTFQCLLLYLITQITVLLRGLRQTHSPLCLSSIHWKGLYRSANTISNSWNVQALFNVITFPALSGNPFIYPQMTIVYTYCRQSLAYKIFITLNAERVIYALLRWGNQGTKG